MQWDTVLFSLSESLRAEDFVLAELQHAPFSPALTLRVAELNACHRRCRQALEAAGEPADPALRSLCSRYFSSLSALAPTETALASGLNPEEAAQEYAELLSAHRELSRALYAALPRPAVMPPVEPILAVYAPPEYFSSPFGGEETQTAEVYAPPEYFGRGVREPESAEPELPYPKNFETESPPLPPRRPEPPVAPVYASPPLPPTAKKPGLFSRLFGKGEKS